MNKKIYLLILAVSLILVMVFWKHDLLLQTMGNYLVVDQKPVPADVIIVLSGGSGRLEQGVRLYNEGYAPKIILSGDWHHYLEQRAISRGVPSTDLLDDENATTTFGNAYYSAQIMRTNGFKSAIVVTSAYHTRRSSIIFGHFFQDWRTTIYASFDDTSISSSTENNQPSAMHVMHEYFKLIYLFLEEIPVQKVDSFLAYLGFIWQIPLY